ncbi:hypothetical protein H4219_003992 [Mycoemilia scoparia]|uniref:Uncharacterized protein n=1 Tax=Mycoemilia scoparia TaxID=417184 RepID=A0A9W8DS50_9FUNG|nr:hypothetical protein H4219_003992 [Mycoemilia scoparia]
MVLSYGKTYIDDLLDFLELLPSSGYNISALNQSAIRNFLEIYLGFSLKDLGLRFPKILSNYEAYRKRIDEAEGDSIYSSEVTKDGLKDIVQFIGHVEAGVTDTCDQNEEEILNGAKMLLKLFGLYNIKLRKNVDFDKLGILTVAIDNALEHINDSSRLSKY